MREEVDFLENMWQVMSNPVSCEMILTTYMHTDSPIIQMQKERQATLDEDTTKVDAIMDISRYSRKQCKSNQRER